MEKKLTNFLILGSALSLPGVLWLAEVNGQCPPRNCHVPDSFETNYQHVTELEYDTGGIIVSADSTSSVMPQF